MRIRSLLAYMAICGLVLSPGLLAKGGHGGGGHGAGHGSGGHSSGGHAASHGAHATASRAATAASASPTSSPAGHSRNGQPVVGTAVPRTTQPATPVTSTIVGPTYIYSPFVGGVVGTSFYDPFFASAPVGFYGQSLAPDPFDADGPSGSLRLKSDRADAQVFVDGYYAGVVGDFDGIFHHLQLGVGPHHVEIRAPGVEPFEADVYILAHHTTVFTTPSFRGRPDLSKDR